MTCTCSCVINKHAIVLSRVVFFSTGQEIIQVQAVDHDDGRNGRLEFFITKDSKQFWINSATGTIHRIPSANVSPGDILLLNVKAKDLGSPSRISKDSALVRVCMQTTHIQLL